LFTWLRNRMAPCGPSHRDLEGDSRSAADPPGDDAAWLARAEKLWRDAQSTHSPFRRHALFEQAATAMVHACGPAIRRYCMAQFRHDPARAADLTQETFFVFWRTINHFEGRSTLRSYLYGIAHNVCRQAARTQRRVTHYEGSLEHVDTNGIALDLNPLPDEVVARDQRRLAVQAALHSMGPRDRWLLEARLGAQKSYAELLPLFRAQFGDDVTTAEGLRSAFFKAKQRLQIALEGG